MEEQNISPQFSWNQVRNQGSLPKKKFDPGIPLQDRFKSNFECFLLFPCVCVHCWIAGQLHSSNSFQNSSSFSSFSQITGSKLYTRAWPGPILSGTGRSCGSENNDFIFTFTRMVPDSHFASNVCLFSCGVKTGKQVTAPWGRVALRVQCTLLTNAPSHGWTPQAKAPWCNRTPHGWIPSADEAPGGASVRPKNRTNTWRLSWPVASFCAFLDIVQLCSRTNGQKTKHQWWSNYILKSCQASDLRRAFHVHSACHATRQRTMTTSTKKPHTTLIIYHSGNYDIKRRIICWQRANAFFMHVFCKNTTLSVTGRLPSFTWIRAQTRQLILRICFARECFCKQCESNQKSKVFISVHSFVSGVGCACCFPQPLICNLVKTSFICMRHDNLSSAERGQSCALLSLEVICISNLNLIDCLQWIPIKGPANLYGFVGRTQIYCSECGLFLAFPSRSCSVSGASTCGALNALINASYLTSFHSREKRNKNFNLPAGWANSLAFIRA